MGSIISSYIFPHPPIIVPEVGKGEEKGAVTTVNAVKKAASDIKNDRPTTIIVITPHGPAFQDYIYISTSEQLSGDFSRFRAGNVALSFVNNIDMVNKIIIHARNEGLLSGGLEDSLARQYKVSKSLDWGATVPLYFVNQEYKDFKLVHISIAYLPMDELYKFGMCITKAVNDMKDENVVFIASGDLSHKLSSDAPYGFNKRGKEFDDFIIESLTQFNVEKLLNIDEALCESAGECGLRSFVMMLGALDGYEVKPKVYSYEGPFGVGYSVARFELGGRNENREILKKVNQENSIKMNEVRMNEDPYVSLARIALEAYVKEEKITEIPEDLPEEMISTKAGTFVSLKIQGRLRGCIGTTGPTRRNIAEEIIYNSICSGTQDPRFDKVRPEELEKLVYSVDVLKDPEPIKSISELDVVKYGVIVKSGRRSGLLLPNLEGVDTPEEQVSIALQKAGIKSDEKYSMERFEVIRHK